MNLLELILVGLIVGLSAFGLSSSYLQMLGVIGVDVILLNTISTVMLVVCLGAIADRLKKNFK